MTTGKNQAKPIVGNFVGVVFGLLSCSLKFGRVGFSFFSETHLAANAIDGLVTRSLDDPGGGRIRNSGRWPLIDGGGKSLLCGFFGDLKVAKGSNEGGNNSPPVGVVNCIYCTAFEPESIVSEPRRCGFGTVMIKILGRCVDPWNPRSTYIEEDVRTTCGSGWLTRT